MAVVVVVMEASRGGLKRLSIPPLAFGQFSFLPCLEMKVLLLITDGSEEMEAVISSDILCRAGLSVTRAAVAVADKTVHCANGMTLLGDVRLEDLSSEQLKAFDCLLLPGGGKGSKTFCRVSTIRFDSILTLIIYLFCF
jgi:hypothetical protein